MGKIGYGTSCLLVKDDSLYERGSAPLYRWLREEGFTFDSLHGYYNNVNWVYVNITSKTFAPGRPGVVVTSVICGHAVTLDEFKQIYTL